MKILGWFLTIIGGILSFGALLSLGSIELNGPTLGAIGLSVALLVIGLVILNNQSKKTKFFEGDKR